MPHKHPNTERIGGPGASHENRKQPEKSRPRGDPPQDAKRGKDTDIARGGAQRSPRTREASLRGGRV